MLSLELEATKARTIAIAKKPDSSVTAAYGLFVEISSDPVVFDLL